MYKPCITFILCSRVDLKAYKLKINCISHAYYYNVNIIYVFSFMLNDFLFLLLFVSLSLSIFIFVEPQWIYSVLARSRRSLMNFDMSEGGRLHTDSNLCEKKEYWVTVSKRRQSEMVNLQWDEIFLCHLCPCLEFHQYPHRWPRSAGGNKMLSWCSLFLRRISNLPEDRRASAAHRTTTFRPPNACGSGSSDVNRIWLWGTFRDAPSPRRPSR